MRHRMCEVTASKLAAFRVEKGTPCQVDGTFLNENLSGNWSKSSGFEMPRKRHENGKEVKVREHFGLLVCVLCSANDLSGVFCEMMNRGEAPGADIKRVFDGKVAEGWIVSNDKAIIPRHSQGL